MRAWANGARGGYTQLSCAGQGHSLESSHRRPPARWARHPALCTKPLLARPAADCGFISMCAYTTRSFAQHRTCPPHPHPQATGGWGTTQANLSTGFHLLTASAICFAVNQSCGPSDSNSTDTTEVISRLASSLLTAITTSSTNKPPQGRQQLADIKLHPHKAHVTFENI